ncbi:MAG: hypothetical protein SF052_09355 [Bacteroidia bacterium]|nr:hypothetical protein [Bacteroidia bacterium]
MLTLTHCEEPCYCGDPEAEVPFYPLPDELKSYFTLAGDSILYILKDSLSGKTEKITLDYSEIVGGAPACGPGCMDILSYRCECRSFYFKSESLFKSIYIRVSPQEESTAIEFHGEYLRGRIDYFPGYIQSEYKKIEFFEDISINGQVYPEVMAIHGYMLSSTISIWFAKDIGLVKLKSSRSVPAYNFEWVRSEVIR